MTISKERFEQLALEVAKDISGFLWYEGCHYETGVSDTDLYEFAHALIKQVEEELINDTSFISDRGTLTSLVELPIVSGNSKG